MSEGAQTSAKDRCQPTTVASCRALALKNGLSWGGSANYGYFGCWAYAENGHAYFGFLGTETEKLQEIVSTNHWFPLRLSSLDTDCLLLSNQAKLFQLVQPRCSDFSWANCPADNGCYLYGNAFIPNAPGNVCFGNYA